MKLTISRKLLFGYLFMALLTVVGGLYALVSLQKIASSSYNITNHHYILMESSKKMMDILLAQEAAEKKYLILKDPELQAMFLQRFEEFQSELARVRGLKLDSKTTKAVIRLDVLHRGTQDLFLREVQLIQSGLLGDAQALSDTEGRAVIDEMAMILRNIQKDMNWAVNKEMNLIVSQASSAVNITLGLCLLSLVLGITLALMITRNISKPLKQLQKATRLIAEGHLDHTIEARRQDEIGALATSFAHMTERLRELEALHLDASPLTGLPGNRAIENKIQELLAAGRMFSLCHIDLDNFKPFADKYGYAWGSEVIKEVANLLQSYIREALRTDIFVGHIGGDDYVLLGDPESIEVVCKKLVGEFERHIHSFYGEEDARNGYFVGKNRQGIFQKFPLITVTAAIVTDNGTRFKNPLEMARVAAELKEYAKMLPGSNYVTEKEMNQTLEKKKPGGQDIMG
jgi:GGDEF domain-containing protein/CHASE3 domain sensor protein